MEIEFHDQFHGPVVAGPRAQLARQIEPIRADWAAKNGEIRRDAPTNAFSAAGMGGCMASVSSQLLLFRYEFSGDSIFSRATTGRS